MLYLWLYSGIYICQPILHNNIHCDYYKLIRNASRKGFLFIYIIIIIRNYTDIFYGPRSDYGRV